VEETQSYPPGTDPPAPVTGTKATRITVENISTMDAARRLTEAGRRPAALNFASAKSPGGGFLSGARAQEECLARSSALYACLRGNPMYAHHAARRDAMYSDYVLYSPDVPFFRDDEGNTLERPYLCSVITSPAVNAAVVLAKDPGRRREVREAMRPRVGKVLAVAAAHGHDTLILGAWGCGAFGNDGADIAGLFRDALSGEFRGVFADVVFAILDWSKDHHFIGPFRAAFADLMNRG
jgi:uncharacterized protein (TIGR02452 family)